MHAHTHSAAGTDPRWQPEEGRRPTPNPAAQLPHHPLPNPAVCPIDVSSKCNHAGARQGNQGGRAAGRHARLCRRRVPRAQGGGAGRCRCASQTEGVSATTHWATHARMGDQPPVWRGLWGLWMGVAMRVCGDQPITAADGPHGHRPGAAAAARAPVDSASLLPLTRASLCLAGGIGQPLSLLMKVRGSSLRHCSRGFPAAPALPALASRSAALAGPHRRCCCFASPSPPLPPASPAALQLSPYVSELALYDIAGTPGVAADVSHINSKATVKGYAGAAAAGGDVPARRSAQRATMCSGWLVQRMAGAADGARAYACALQPLHLSSCS